MLITTDGMQGHTHYRQHLGKIKRQQTRLITELPVEDEKVPIGKTTKTFRRWMSFAVVAKEVYVLALRFNPYGHSGKPFFR